MIYKQIFKYMYVLVEIQNTLLINNIYLNWKGGGAVCTLLLRAKEYSNILIRSTSYTW